MRTMKRFTAKERAAMFTPTYVFGYGSLLLARGINGRNMRKYYRNKDLQPATLEGYTRSMCAYFGGRNFYGLLEEEKALCNGVVFKIEDWYDYRAFLFSEGATAKFKHYRTYWPINVTGKISGWEVPEGYRVVTLLCKKDKSKLGRIQRSYVYLCHEGAKIWGPEFEKNFLETGGIPYDRQSMKDIAKKFGIKFW